MLWLKLTLKSSKALWSKWQDSLRCSEWLCHPLISTLLAKGSPHRFRCILSTESPVNISRSGPGFVQSCLHLQCLTPFGLTVGIQFRSVEWETTINKDEWWRRAFYWRDSLIWAKSVRFGVREEWEKRKRERMSWGTQNKKSHFLSCTEHCAKHFI